MRHSGNGYTRRVHCALQLLNTFERSNPKLLRDRFGPRCILIHHPNKLDGIHLTIHTRMIPAELARTHNGNTTLSMFPRHAPFAHSFFIPRESPVGSAAGANGKAWIAIPASLAMAISFSLSKRSVRFASMA